jgi:hypothetical protein
MPDIVIIGMIWGTVSAAVAFGVVGMALHIKDELREGHRAVLVYGPLVLAAMAAFGVWIVRSWILNWGN